MRFKRKQAAAVKVEDPQFMSLVKNPANRAGFKVIRSQEEKVRRNDGLLSITLPAGITRDEAESLIETFDLGEDYYLTGDEESTFVLMRRGAEEETGVTVNLNNGLTATIATEAFANVRRHDEDEDPLGVVVTSFVFDKSVHTRASAVAWLEENQIDCSIDDDSESVKKLIAIRHDDYAELPKAVEVAEGVTAMVVRGEETDVPVKVYRSVVEEAYGSWGWGIIDFAQAMANPEFQSKSWDAIYILRDILENIVLYSELPLDERKILLQNAVASFTSYMFGLMDSLPRAVTQQARTDTNQEINEMAGKDAKKTEKPVDAARTDAKVTDNAAPEGQEEHAAREDAETLTRADIAAMISEGITAAFAARDEAAQAKVESSEESGKEQEAARSDENGKDAPKEEGPALLDAVKEQFGQFGDMLKGIRSEIDELKSGTVAVRSDSQDDEVTEEQAKRSEGRYAGIFGRRK